MYEDSARFQARQARLSQRFDKAVREKDYHGIIRARFAMLGYSYDEGDDSGGGSALASITSAAATLGSAYIQSQQPANTTVVPTRTNPAYGAAAPTGSGTILLVLVAVAAVTIFALRG